MESQDKEKEYEHSIWEIYLKEWETASNEKRIELNKQMRRWQELMKSGLTANQAYYRAMQEESDKSPIYTLIEEESGSKVAEKPLGKQLAISSAPQMRKAPLILLSLALVAAIIYSVVITGDRNALYTELESVESILVSTQAELVSTEQTLTSTQSELGLTKGTLATTQSELISTEMQLGSTKETLTSTQQQLAVAQETLGGLGITLYTSKECYGSALIDNPTAKNPTWSQLRTFLSQDQTEKHAYIENVYDCTEYSRDVHNKAEAAGIRAAIVHTNFRSELVGHALNAFLTTDYGLVYVDCTERDTVARIKTGKEYRAVELYGITGANVRNDYWWDALSSYYYFQSSFSLPWDMRGQVTSSIKIYW